MARVLVLVLLMSGCAAAQRRGWTATDTTMQVAFAATMVVDYYQTERIIMKGTEDNPIVGTRGERVPPIVYFPIVETVFVVASWYLPKPWRRSLEGLGLGGEISVIYRNTKHLQWEVRQ